jgi:mono/diheme cytochrome c family protein
MRQGVVIALVISALPIGVAAQVSPDASFSPAQREGLRLFSQSCGVCHTPVVQRGTAG